MFQDKIVLKCLFFNFIIHNTLPNPYFFLLPFNNNNHHDITEILLKMVLNTIKPTNQIINAVVFMYVMVIRCI
jgi:hypothetical protein